MKTFLCVLFVSMSALSQTKNTQRYQIIECNPIAGINAIFLIDGETGRTWKLYADTLFFSWDKSSTVVHGHENLKNYWQEVPFALSPTFQPTSKQVIDFPGDENIEYFKQPSEEKKK
jgi:hypothetical protein